MHSGVSNGAWNLKYCKVSGRISTQTSTPVVNVVPKFDDASGRESGVLKLDGACLTPVVKVDGTSHRDVLWNKGVVGAKWNSYRHGFAICTVRVYGRAGT
jgi:hypothetical protein